MTEYVSIEEQLRRDIGIFLIGLQTKKGINHQSFDSINRLSKDLARSLKGSDLVSKSLLNELRVFIKNVRTELPYAKDNASVLESMANTIEMTFDLILRGESHDDRQPGVPRIV